MGGYGSGRRLDSENRVYALYKGDDLLMMGTEIEIAEYRDVSVNTIRYMRTPSYKKRMGNSRYCLRVVPADEDEYEDDDFEEEFEIVEPVKPKSKVNAYRSLANTLQNFEEEFGDILRSMKEAKT